MALTFLFSFTSPDPELSLDVLPPLLELESCTFARVCGLESALSVLIGARGLLLSLAASLPRSAELWVPRLLLDLEVSSSSVEVFEVSDPSFVGAIRLEAFLRSLIFFNRLRYVKRP